MNSTKGGEGGRGRVGSNKMSSIFTFFFLNFLFVFTFDYGKETKILFMFERNRGLDSSKNRDRWVTGGGKAGCSHHLALSDLLFR